MTMTIAPTTCPDWCTGHPTPWQGSAASRTHLGADSIIAGAQPTTVRLERLDLPDGQQLTEVMIEDQESGHAVDIPVRHARRVAAALLRLAEEAGA